MRTRGRAALAAATAVMTLAFTGPAGQAAAGGAADPRTDEPGWHVWPLGSARDQQELRAVAALGPRDAWAVGYQGSLDTARPLVQHFDGIAWQAVNVPGHGLSGHFETVLPLGARDVWAIGHWNDMAAHNDRALAVHFDGWTWRETPMPYEPEDRSAYPFAAAALGSDDVWAVGATATDRLVAPAPLAYHWDGLRWRSARTPDTGGDAILLSAAADRAGGVWAVGVAYDKDGVGRPLVEHWDGTAWRLVTVPFDAQHAYSLEGVTALGPDDAWAVGSVSTESGESRPLVYHWDGAAWTQVQAPAIDAALHAVSADPATGTVWAVGGRATGETPALTLRWDGAGWRELPAAPEPGGVGASLFAVAAVPDAQPGGVTVWAAGSNLPSTPETNWHAVIEGYGTAPRPAAPAAATQASPLPGPATPRVLPRGGAHDHGVRSH
ncbi:hypothetical protein [Yinghuangia seranimata]|uniref:hypothetical protein n=1 Tax=Yinghuangia seranimata TaxID=408067 RepID=UPI00248BC0AE|nr:hypothetical protein [Yinghuangia seranimata]MDI2132336.1 hypothetical protein [Yinghuangia seranimata]